MEVTSYLLGKKAGGGGSEPTGTINITSNGTKNVKSYATANVNVQPNLQNKSVTVNANGSTSVSADNNYDGLDTVSITTSVQPDLETKSVTITENGTTTVSPTSGKDGLSQVEITTNVSGGGADINNYFNTVYDGSSSSFGHTILKQFPTITIASGVTSLSYVFNDCGYEHIAFEGIDCTNITDITSMFSNSTKLETIDFKNVSNTSNITNASNLLYFCGALTTVSNMFYLTGNASIATAFSNCQKLTSLDLSNWHININDRYHITSAFSTTRKLTYLDISNITIDNSVTLSTNTFSNCGVDSLQSDGAYADGIPYVYVKDATAQSKVIAAHSGWSTNNVIIKNN